MSKRESANARMIFARALRFASVRVNYLNPNELNALAFAPIQAALDKI